MARTVSCDYIIINDDQNIFLMKIKKKSNDNNFSHYNQHLKKFPRL